MAREGRRARSVAEGPWRVRMGALVVGEMVVRVSISGDMVGGVGWLVGSEGVKLLLLLLLLFLLLLAVAYFTIK